MAVDAQPTKKFGTIVVAIVPVAAMVFMLIVPLPPLPAPNLLTFKQSCKRRFTADTGRASDCYLSGAVGEAARQRNSGQAKAERDAGIR